MGIRNVTIVQAIEKLIDAKAMPASLQSSDNGPLDAFLSQRDEQAIEAARRELQWALDQLAASFARETS